MTAADHRHHSRDDPKQTASGLTLLRTQSAIRNRTLHCKYVSDTDLNENYRSIGTFGLQRLGVSPADPRTKLQQGQALFRIEMNATGEDRVVIALHGELDHVSMPEFDATIGQAVERVPAEIVFDLLDAEFVAVAGYAAIGRCTSKIARVIVRAPGGIAQRVLRLLGFDLVVYDMTARILGP